MTITRTAINLLARSEGVHPAHMANRLTLAIRVAEAAAEVAPGIRPESVLNAALNGMPAVVAALTEASNPAMGRLSESTLRLALSIVEVEG